MTGNIPIMSVDPAEYGGVLVVGCPDDRQDAYKTAIPAEREVIFAPDDIGALNVLWDVYRRDGRQTIKLVVVQARSRWSCWDRPQFENTLKFIESVRVAEFDGVVLAVARSLDKKWKYFVADSGKGAKGGPVLALVATEANFLAVTAGRRRPVFGPNIYQGNCREQVVSYESGEFELASKRVREHEELFYRWHKLVLAWLETFQYSLRTESLREQLHVLARLAADRVADCPLCKSRANDGWRSLPSSVLVGHRFHALKDAGIAYLLEQNPVIRIWLAVGLLDKLSTTDRLPRFSDERHEREFCFWLLDFLGHGTYPQDEFPNVSYWPGE